MIDPTNITNYNLSEAQLEEIILFWVCAAGKSGIRAAKSLDILLNNIKQKFGLDNLSPFQLILLYRDRLSDLAAEMKTAGIGCYNHKSKTFLQLATSGLNLATCSVDDLEKIYGIGCKTARCFIIHSRPNQRLAGLDVHILHFLRDCGYDVPKSTPNKKQYAKIEQWFLQEADKSRKGVAEFDLAIWNKYRR